MNTHKGDRSATAVISARDLKMLGAGLQEAVPLELPDETAGWWTGRGTGRGRAHLIPEIQRVLWNPPTIRNELKHWSAFYLFLLREKVQFNVPVNMLDRPAENWVFVPRMWQSVLEGTLQQLCENFFPAYERRLTIGTATGNKSRDGRSYMIEVRQGRYPDMFEFVHNGGTPEVTLAEVLIKELYYYFRGVRRPMCQWTYAMGSWFDDDSVPATRWTHDGLQLGRFRRAGLKYHCFMALTVLDK